MNLGFASFPVSVWDGLYPTNDDRLDDVNPNFFALDRITSEIVSVEQYLFDKQSIFDLFDHPGNAGSFISVNNGQTGLIYRDIVAGAGIDLNFTDDELIISANAVSDHGALTGLLDDDHTQYILVDGTRTLTGDLSVVDLITIDGRDLSVDGIKLDTIEAGADVTDANNVAAAGAAMAGGAFHDGFSDFVAAEHLLHPNTITNTLTDHNLAAHTSIGLQEVISANTTYYISTTGSDITGNGTSGNPWATLNKALNVLADKALYATVTITLGDGTYTFSTSTITHPNGDKINIRGTNVYSKTLNSIQSSSGSAGNWSIVLNLNNVTNIAANDFILIPYNISSGTRPETLCGCWKITNVDVGNSRITITSTHKYSSAPSGNVTGTITIIKTILSYSGAQHGIVVAAGRQLGLIYNLVILGDNTSGYTGIALTTKSICGGASGLGIHGFDSGLNAAAGGHYSGWGTIISNCATVAVRLYYSSINAAQSVFSGSGIAFWGSTSDGELAYSIFSGNTNGIFNDENTRLGAYGTKVTYNINYGIYGNLNSVTNAFTASVTGNGTNFSPVPNTEGNADSYTVN